MSDGDWHHLAVTVNTQTRSDSGYDLEIFHNGVSAGGGPITEGVIFPGSQLVLGQRFFGDLNDQFIGQFADFAVWHTIRTPAEIRSDMSNGISGDEPQLGIH